MARTQKKIRQQLLKEKLHESPFLTDGELSVIGENPIFDGVKALSLNTNSTNNFNSLIEYNQYLKGSLYNEVGIQANTVMKRERVNSDEVNANNDLLFPFIYNMLENRLTAIKAINEKYSENIAVDFYAHRHLPCVDHLDNSDLDHPGE